MFSAPLMFRHKAQCATKAQTLASAKAFAALMGLGPASVANVVGLPCKTRLAMNADKLTEYDNIPWKGH